MKIVEPFNATGKFNSLYGCRNAIFLAGPCPRKDFTADWRFGAFKLLESLKFDGIVITPSNPMYKDMTSKYGMTAEQA